MDLWDAEAIDLLGPAFIEFNGRTGSFRFIAVECSMAESAAIDEPEALLSVCPNLVSRRGQLQAERRVYSVFETGGLVARQLRRVASLVRVWRRPKR